MLGGGWVLVMVLPGDLLPALLGAAAALASVALQLSGADYWKFSVAVTVSVILLTFERQDALAGDLQRILITLAGAVVVAATVWVASILSPAEPAQAG
ncbi:hypothetical protein [Micropruina sonneratiae]|uniref:hypothetical protein n=1 Tax=Micropruina sonneratiae TaxID=2986940 RepID=UPI00222738E0|nr:hypothetical protein [Micropruina sp. KQZ13P-5]MCW3159509.1 hypothetical protein [Micropruina sp. KQZ13P-5]